MGGKGYGGQRTPHPALCHPPPCDSDGGLVPANTNAPETNWESGLGPVPPHPTTFHLGLTLRAEDPGHLLPWQLSCRPDPRNRDGKVGVSDPQGLRHVP